MAVREPPAPGEYDSQRAGVPPAATGMEFCLLGPLVVRCGGAVLTVPRGMRRTVLAALLLSAGQVVSLDRLIEILWGDSPPLRPPVTVQNHVCQLRKALGPAAGRLCTQPPGYLIRVSAGELDVSRFEAHLAAARKAASDGAWSVAAIMARAGLSLWRGDALADVDCEVLAAREVPRLAEMWQQAAKIRMEADLRLGRHAEVIPELRRLVSADPLREDLHALLMLALYRDGRQGAALAAYQQARQALIAELGNEPGRLLQEVHQRILTGDPTLEEPASGAASSVGLAEPRQPGPEPRVAGRAGELAPGLRYALPPDTAAFTGRGEELAAITAQVTGAAQAGGVVAIYAIGGMPGIGKTALAIHAARQLRDQFPDRQLFIDLHAHTPGQDPVPPGDALAGLLTAIGADARSLPDDTQARAGLWRDQMAGQRALLVLDNAASTEQVAPLLPGGEGCLVLVTSRRHLGDLPGITVPVPLGALPPDQAQAMFLQLAASARDDPGAATAVPELARLAGYLPLAISLLARVYARHSSWTLDDLARETQGSLLTLAAERDTIAAAFYLSYHHLRPDRRWFFRRLGLHPGTTIDEHAAAALADVPLAQAAAQLDALHGEGLLTETGYHRYGMHDLIRHYARDRAQADPAHTRDQALDRLLDHYQHTATLAEALLARQTRPSPAAPVAGPTAASGLTDRTRALAWARAERANLLACLDHVTAVGQHARIIALTTGLAGLLRQDGPWADALSRHAAAAQAARQLGDRLAEASALNDLGDIRRLTGDYPTAAQALEQALGIYRDLGDRLGQANALSNLGMAQWLTDDYPAAIWDHEQALGIYRDLGDRLGEAAALTDLGLVWRMTGEYTAAVQALEQALSIYRDLGDRLGEAGALGILGAVRRRTGDYPAAAQTLEQALGIHRALGNRVGEANALGILGAVRRLTGDYPAAARDLEQALGIFRDLGSRGGEAETLNETGTLHRVSGDLAQAEGFHCQALELARAIASSWDEAHALAGLGRCAIAAGHATKGQLLLRQAREIFRRIGAAEAADIVGELDA